MFTFSFILDVQRNEFLHKLLKRLDSRQLYFISSYLSVSIFLDKHIPGWELSIQIVFHVYFKLGYHPRKKTFKTNSKYGFAGMKIELKYAFLHAVFLIFCYHFLQKFVTITKNTPFFPICMFLHP